MCVCWGRGITAAQYHEILLIAWRISCFHGTAMVRGMRGQRVPKRAELNLTAQKPSKELDDWLSSLLVD